MSCLTRSLVTGLSLSAVLVVFALPASAQEPARTQTQDQDQDQDQDQEQVYGSQLMTRQERDEYRTRMRNAATAEEREQIRQEHHERMQTRAKERNVRLPDEPPARGRGMGSERGMDPERGMGQGGGMGSERGMGQGGGQR